MKNMVFVFIRIIFGINFIWSTLVKFSGLLIKVCFFLSCWTASINGSKKYLQMKWLINCVLMCVLHTANKISGGIIVEIVISTRKHFNYNCQNGNKISLTWAESAQLMICLKAHRSNRHIGSERICITVSHWYNMFHSTRLDWMRWILRSNLDKSKNKPKKKK